MGCLLGAIVIMYIPTAILNLPIWATPFIHIIRRLNIMQSLNVVLQLIVYFGPYLLAAAAGGYVEAKYGQSLVKDYAAAKAELAAIKAKV
jgi:hypothetical protein